MRRLDAPSAPTILLATRSAGKLRELLPLFAEYGLAVETLTDAGIEESAAEDVLEVFDSFEENAFAKARYFHRMQPTRVVIAEDSGLAVDALHGAPGVRSKRWSNRPDLAGDALDAANNAHLLSALEHAGALLTSARRARYVCAAACVGPGVCEVRRGTTEGLLLSTARGTEGFGYDPYFLSDDLGQTFAEVTREEKARVSHRGRAFAQLLAALRAASG